MYDAGPEELRKQRLAKLVEMGIIEQSVVPHEIIAPDVDEWEMFDDQEKKCSSRAMETYAGMVESLDAAIGRVIDDLKRRGEYDNTMIVFMSDNGACGAALEAIREYHIERAESSGHGFENLGLDQEAL
jgi:arylsulfatase